MRDRGYIPAYRKVFDPDHWLAPSKRDPASKLHAWLDLCQLATHEPVKVLGEQIERGQTRPLSVRFLATRWGWSKSKVLRFICDLEARTMIGTVSGTERGTVYRIVNYDTYASPRDTERDTERDDERDTSGTAAGQSEEQENRRRTDNKPARRKSRLSDEWAPHDNHKAKAKELGLSLASEVEGFRYHARANGRTQLDWDAAFFMWMHNAVKFGRANKPTEQAVGEDFVQQELEKRQKAIADMEARRAG